MGGQRIAQSAQIFQSRFRGGFIEERLISRAWRVAPASRWM